MIRILRYTAIFALTMAVLVPATYANSTPQSSSFPHVISLVESPQGIRHWRILRHTLKIAVPENSKAISQLIIEAPANIVLRENIDVSEESGKKIAAKVSIQGKKATLEFAESVASGTTIIVEMNNVKKTAVTTGDKFYKISTIFAGTNAELPIGVAQLRVI
ncbi:DUF2808 domain-containing protein [Fischerella thermalis CCMEE 5330]|uniref:DUF2808 domain-containing protein n=3 Tax=Cyanophyceae TaxID=3028117 RepID=A0A2H6LKK1_9NOSO|nr:DUF2808 domain-containing protein [Fischerella thermalis CCMEE 5330]GBE93751.1 hypothetical protein NCWK1_3516 [Nostoc cycadae WK-1]